LISGLLKLEYSTDAGEVLRSVCILTNEDRFVFYCAGASLMPQTYNLPRNHTHSCTIYV